MGICFYVAMFSGNLKAMQRAKKASVWCMFFSDIVIENLYIMILSKDFVPKNTYLSLI